jgi:hypothetical protein
MNLFWSIVTWIVVLWLFIGLYNIIRNWNNTKQLMKMALQTGRKEGVGIRKDLDKKLGLKK